MQGGVASHNSALFRVILGNFPAGFMATKGLGKTHLRKIHGSPAEACQLWVCGRRKIASQPSPILQPWGQRLQVRDKKLGPMFEAPDGNEGPTLQSGFFFESLVGSSAYRRIVQWHFLRTKHTPRPVAPPPNQQSDGFPY